MDYKELIAKEKQLGGYCRKCPICNGVACKGECPGVGGIGSGISFINNVKAMDKYCLIQDNISDVDTVDTSIELFGHTLSAPIMIAPVGNVKGNYGVDMQADTYFSYILQGADNVNTLAFGGDDSNVDFFNIYADMIDNNGYGINTIKPWIQQGLDIRFDHLKDKKFTAIAMDIDSAGLPALAASKIPVENKNIDKLKQVKALCKNKPFIVKGIMSVNSALKAVQAGADAIVVSNHGGRVLDQSCGSMDVLEDICDAVKDKTIVLVDGGFRNGSDILKALALGAKAVLVGRPFILAALAGQSEGVQVYYKHLQDELIHGMKMCGYDKIWKVNKDCLYKKR